MTRFVTMQNLFHDGGFSFTGVSEAIVNSMKEPAEGANISA
jgi:enoyl-[acyl-carrier protein] reductase I